MMNGAVPATQPPVKIAVVIASRGRPSALCGAIMAAHRLQSGRNMIAFVAAVDEDDRPTLAMVDAMIRDDDAKVVPSIAPRPPYLGAAQNRGIAEANDADIVTLLSDRTFCITPAWDQVIVDAAVRYPNRVLWWSDPFDADTTVPIIPHTVLDALDWTWSPELWPFWFDDTWWTEVDRMVFGGPSLRTRAMFSGVRAQTTSGRDFAFWTKLWVALRPRRIKQAKMLAGKLGVPWHDPPADMLEDFHARDAHLLASAERFEEAFGDRRDPSEQYLAAKARAEALMKEIGA